MYVRNVHLSHNPVIRSEYLAISSQMNVYKISTGEGNKVKDSNSICINPKIHIKHFIFLKVTCLIIDFSNRE